MEINKKLKEYVEKNIFPLYENNYIGDNLDIKFTQFIERIVLVYSICYWGFLLTANTLFRLKSESEANAFNLF